jgi:DNA polymerase I-like protein with 3'-5' exonuclease and polymerase domains
LWSGRVRHFDDSVALHSASNTYVQGGVSELLRVATVRIHREVPEFRMGITVHDMVGGDLPECSKQQREIVHEVKKIMSDYPWLDPPIHADVKLGKSWATAKHYE